MIRRFELNDENSSKFWAIEVTGDSHTVTYGKIGTKGRRSARTFENEEEARATCEKLIAQKEKKGYLEIVTGAVAIPASTPSDKISNDDSPTGQSDLFVILGLSLGKASGQISKYGKKARNFKLSKTSSLKGALELAYALYAVKNFNGLVRLADFLLENVDKVRTSDKWCVQYVLAIAARLRREFDQVSDAEKYMACVETLAFNPTILTREWVEREHQWAYLRMTVRSEEEWRINMLYILCLIIEVGGSRNLPIGDAEVEFQEHLVHLRAILGVEQATPPARPKGRYGPFPVKSHLFDEYKKVAGVLPPSSNNKNNALEVKANEDGWVRCPTCNFGFKAADKHAYDGKRHRRCKQKLTVIYI
jgi:predicted DNA-binding WGR domain protein